MRHPDDHHDPSEPIDARLREALEPEPGAVERLVRRALSPEKAGGTPAVPGKSTRAAGVDASPSLFPRDRRRPAGMRRLLPATALAAALLALAALALWRPRPEPPPPPAATITITNVGDVVVATSPAGPHWLIRSEPGAAAPAGSVLILRRHEP